MPDESAMRAVIVTIIGAQSIEKLVPDVVADLMIAKNQEARGIDGA